MTDLEEWRPIPGFPDYQVSNTGRVISYMGKAPRELKQCQGTFYRHVRLYSGQRGRTMAIHRIVAAAFLGPRPGPRIEIRHVNGDRFDNRSCNLQWGTRSENAVDAVEHGTHPETRKTQCVNGHAFDEQNTYRYGRARQCRTCKRNRERDRQRRLRLAAANIDTGVKAA